MTSVLGCRADLIRAVTRTWRCQGPDHARAIASEHELPASLIAAIDEYIHVNTHVPVSSTEYGAVQRAHAEPHAAELPNGMCFPPGVVVVTRGAIAALDSRTSEQNHIVVDLIRPLMSRHLQADWGDVDPADRAVNEAALREGARLLSVYSDPEHHIYVITEWDRSVTTVLLADEY